MPPLLPRCSSCARRLSARAIDGFRPLQQHQVRGKKKLAVGQHPQGDVVPVQLLKDVKTFGKRGAYVPISRGEMRNRWYPQRVAQYASAAALKELEAKNIRVERDYEFGLEDPRRKQQQEKRSEVLPVSSVLPAFAELAGQAATAPVKPVELELLSPERSLELFEIFIPSHIDFYRPVRPIEPTEAEKKQQQQAAEQQQTKPRQRGGAFNAADILAAAARAQPKLAPKPEVAATQAGQAIFGSVSTSDVMNSVRALLAENDEAARVVLNEHDITFLGGVVEEGEVNRVKTTGEFEVRITVKGAVKDAGVVRKVRVLPESNPTA